MSGRLADYWRLLRLTEDYFDGQTRGEREYAVPEFRDPAPAPPAPPARAPTPRAAAGAAPSADLAGPNPAGPAPGGPADAAPARSRPAHAPADRTPADRRAPGRSADGPAPAADDLGAVAAEVAACRLCRLCEGRANTVPGEGAPSPDVVVIGEGPGAAEDRSGRPFVGPAGQYLDRWLAAIALDRGRNCFIANVVKCRPPGNRDPGPDEVAACMPYLERQIDLLRPRALLAVGRVAADRLLGVARPLAAHRTGRYEYRGRPLFVTYHPSAVLRDQSLRAPVWQDLRKLRAFLDGA